MSRLAIVITARPSYAKLKPVIQALVDTQEDPDLYVCASALLPRYGYVYAQIRQDFPDLACIPVYSVFEGSETISSVLSTGALTSALGSAFAYHKPTLVTVMADRHETLAASVATAYQNIPLVHLQGGESSGNIDNKVRAANTALADFHVPATALAANQLSRVGIPRTAIFQHGCPSTDVARQAELAEPVTDEELGGDGDELDLSEPFWTVLYHPETEHPDTSYRDMTDLLSPLSFHKFPTVVFWPGQDSGMEGVSKAIREFKGHGVRTVRTLPPERFLRLMCQTTALIGNSSTGIRECSYLGTPVINLGNRQRGRERGQNVIDRPVLRALDLDGALCMPRFSSTLYGDGHVAPRIAATLKDILCQ